MDYEKMYNEALERAKKFEEKYGGGYAEYIFPELAESEDERIKKTIRQLLETARDAHSNTSLAKPFIDALAWLEKQKESLHIPETCKENADSFTDIKDRNIRGCIGMALADISESRFKMYGVTLKECLAWLEKQKEPENTSASTMAPSCWAEEPSLQKEPKPAWSEEDEKMLDSIIRVVCGVGIQPNGLREKQVSFLKSLRPQPKAELTLLDKNIINAAVAFVEQNNHFNCWGGIDKHTVIKALRSLKPSWKPSEEQMDRLFSIVAALRKDYCDDMADFLANLYADLEKLGVKKDEKI